MAIQLTAQDAQLSLNAHVAAKAAEVRERHGPTIGWKELLHILNDRTCVRYPCDIVFDPGPLASGECAHPVAKGALPEDGFTMHVHPCFMAHLHLVPPLVLYQLVVVNYGVFASAEDAETFGSIVLGISRDEYYSLLCDLHDSVGATSAACGACH